MDGEQLRILLIGNGGREHALAWKLSQSTQVEIIFVVPGNGGTAHGLSKVKNVPQVSQGDFEGLITFARAQDVNLVVPGPEVPLVNGVEGFFRRAGIPCFGPSKAAARMEGSKTFAKDFMARHNIPTARYENFSAYEAAKAHLDAISYDVVIKADGLAAGKGVVIPSTKKEANDALEQIMLNKEFGSAGDEVVIEEYLQGDELSFLSFSDGYTIRTLPPAQDHKQVFDNDKGPNTGGMGCYAPAPLATSELIDEVHRIILQPTIDGMRKEGFPMVGMLFTGIMVTKDGPRTLEYNVRFGDPETQTLLPLLSKDSDLAKIMLACTDRQLDSRMLNFNLNPGYSATVVAAAHGYPGKYDQGHVITLVDPPSDTIIFHAGTALDSGQFTSSGGRVIAATSTASTLDEALSRAYAGMASISFPRMHFRKDIGHRALRATTMAARSSTSETPITYASAGVSISSGNNLVDRIRPLVASTAQPWAPANIGGFGGVVDLSLAGYPSAPRTVFGTDGVGTKVKIAQAMEKHDTIGIDLVAMSVNDIVVQGAKPLAFLDCFTCSKLNVSVAAEFVKGVCDGCREAGCALVGGETAEMPGLFADEAKGYDPTGTAFGIIDSGKPLLPDKESMKVGDILLGLASSGCHSNGYSLIRKIVDRAGLSYQDPAPWHDDTEGISVGQSLLTPTRIYVKSLLRVVEKNLVKGMAHITGGGLFENVPRMLPRHLAADMDASTWDVPGVMRWLKRMGNLTDDEFGRVLNTGLGMVLVVAKEQVEQTSGELRDAGETVWVVGKVVEREGVGCVVRGTESWR